MSCDNIEQLDDCHNLAICDVTPDGFELLCGSRIQPPSADDESDTQWEEPEN